MVSVGLRALITRKHTTHSLIEDRLVTDKDYSYSQVGKEKKMGRKWMKKHAGQHADHPSENASSGRVIDESVKARNFHKNENVSAPQTSFLRKQVDPETVQYFTEISNVIEGNEVDLEERSVICGNALEEARGKEIELATDYIISHTLQTLLEGCSLDHLCGFLRSCAKSFSHIAMDRSGSHVAETALKSLALHLEDAESYSMVEDTLSTVCKAIVANPFDIMCNCYGSHVLRSLLCLCHGVPLDSSEFHSTKSSVVLAERLNFKSPQQKAENLHHSQRFPDLLKFLVSEIIKFAGKDLHALQVNQYSSLVLQTALKLIAGCEEELLQLVPILFGCKTDTALKGKLITKTEVQNIRSLVEEMAFSHLMEVVLEVAPDTLYNELFKKVFRNSLFEMSSHQCGNFVVQALISHTRSQDQIEMVLEELGGRFKELLEMGRHGVVASLIAASQRLQSHEQKCAQALTSAVCTENESARCIVPRILYLDSYFYCEDKSNWSWPSGSKIHVMGSLILQSIYRLPSEFIQAYIASITSLEDNQVLEASKDPSGARVIEAFLSSNASTKQKRKLIVKLRGHFGEISLRNSGSFTVEKCFNAGNVSMRETIVSELLLVQTELSKTKQGPYLLRKLDVDGFAKRPDQWKSRQASKQSAYNEYFADFGSKDTRSSQSESFLAGISQKSQPEKLKEMRREIDTGLASSMATTSGTPFLAHQGTSGKSRKSGYKRTSEEAEVTNHTLDPTSLTGASKKGKKDKAKTRTGNSIANGVVENEYSLKSAGKGGKKRHQKDDISKSSHKKMKVEV